MLVRLPLVSPKAALFGGGLEESGTTLSVRRPFEPPPLLGSYWFGGWAWGVRNVPGRSPPLRAAPLLSTSFSLFVLRAPKEGREAAGVGSVAHCRFFWKDRPLKALISSQERFSVCARAVPRAPAGRPGPSPRR